MRGQSQFFASISLLLFLVTGRPGAVCEAGTQDTARLIEELHSNDFLTRKAATTALKQQGRSACPAVKQAVQSADLEVSRRCLGILQFWLHSENRATVQAANAALRELESSNDERICGAAMLARRDAPENIIKRLEKLGARFTYRHDNEVTGVDLSRQGISNRDVAALRSFYEVESIDLDYTEITSEVLSTFRNFSQLRELRLRCDCLQDEHLRALEPLSKLEVLNLWRTGLSDAGLKSLAALHQLKDLNLGCNRITDDGLKHLSEMKDLTTLNLVKTDITDRGLKHLVALPKLKYLNVKGTRVTTSGVQFLQQQCPDLNIRYCHDRVAPCDHCPEKDSNPHRPVDSDTSVRFE